MILVDSRINRAKYVIVKQDNRLIDELMKINIYFHGKRRHWTVTNN